MRILTLCFSFFLINSMQAQSWELLNTELKATREDGKLNVSFLDNRASLILEADTVYLDAESGFVFFQHKGRIGVIDPWDLLLIQEAEFISIKSVDAEYYIIQTDEGYSFSYPEFPVDIYSDTYDSYSRLNSSDFPFGPEEPLLVQKKGKTGLIYPFEFSDNCFIEPEFDHISVENASRENILMFVEKASKWGAARCEGIEVNPKYEEIRFLGGNCGESAYIVGSKNKYGIIRSFESKPIVPLDYDQITILQKEYTDYVFLFNEERIEKMYRSESEMFWFEECEPIMLLTLEDGKGFRLIYRAEGDVLSLEITDDEIYRTEIYSLDWVEL